MISSFLFKRRGTTLAGVFSLALSCALLLCGAGSVPVENFSPQGVMQNDLNAGGHNLTNAATVSATNVIVSGSLTAPTSFTLPFASLTSTPTTLSGYGITDPVVVTSGSYANPSWLTSLAYAKLTGTPTLGTLAALSPTGTADGSHYLRGDDTWATVPSGYTLPVATSSVLGGVKQGANVTIAGDGTLSVSAPVTSLPFSSITSTPTTLSGYGITDPVVLTSGSYANPSWLTSLAYAKLTGTPTLGTLAALSPTGTADSSHYLRGDNTWATGTSGYTLPNATSSTLGGVTVPTSGGLAVSSGAISEQDLTIDGSSNFTFAQPASLTFNVPIGSYVGSNRSLTTEGLGLPQYVPGTAFNLVAMGDSITQNPGFTSWVQDLSVMGFCLNNGTVYNAGIGGTTAIQGNANYSASTAYIGLPNPGTYTIHSKSPAVTALGGFLLCNYGRNDAQAIAGELNQVTTTGTFTSGSNIVTSLASNPMTDGTKVGATVLSSGFLPANTTITSIDSSTQIHVSNNAISGGGPIAVYLATEILSDAQTALQGIWSAARTDGFHIVQVQLLYSGSPTDALFQSTMTTLRTWIDAQQYNGTSVTSGWDYEVKALSVLPASVTTGPLFQQGGTGNNGVHPTTAGCQVIADATNTELMNDYGSTYVGYPLTYQGIPWSWVGLINSPIIAGTSGTPLSSRNIFYGNTSNDYAAQFDANVGNTYGQIALSQLNTPYWSIQGNPGQFVIKDIVHGQTQTISANGGGVSLNGALTAGSFSTGGSITATTGNSIKSVSNIDAIVAQSYNNGGTAMLSLRNNAGTYEGGLVYADSSASQGYGTASALGLILKSVLHITSGGTTDVATISNVDGTVTSFGNVISDTAGKGLQVKEGSNAKQGTATLSSGTATVSDTAVTANSRIFLTTQTAGGTVGTPYVSARTAGTSFTITSTSGSDTSTVGYEIFEPAP